MEIWEEKLKEKVNSLPLEPGVYRYFNEAGTIIYIGKAKSLKNRVSSYFVKSNQHDRKTRKLVSEIRDMQFTVVNSELDALLLENNLIKQFQPKYNILLKDGKSYPYICVTNEPFPRVFSIRNIKDTKHKYYGPYANVRMMNTLLELFQKLYHLRTCNYQLTPANIGNKKFKVCMEYHIKNCFGPCEGLQEESTYLPDIEQIESILKGKIGWVKTYFKEQMAKAAAEMNFEEAQQYKQRLDLVQNYQSKSTIVNPSISDVEVYTLLEGEMISTLNYMKIEEGAVVLTESMQIKRQLEETAQELLMHAIVALREKYASPASRIISNIELELDWKGVSFSVPKIGDMKQLIELSLKNAFYFRKEKERQNLNRQQVKDQNSAVTQLKLDLNLSEMPDHIECFDNSNIQGTNPVASMVCFKNGKPAKSDYRHFHIKTVEGPDDFASMYEIVTRRYKRLKEEEQPFPNLIIIDGGKGQLSAACRALKDLEIYGQIPIIGIAKRLEEIYFPDDSLPLHISKKSTSLRLIQRARDEAHRFAITFHRDVRSNQSIQSSLDGIEGVGPKTIQKLLAHFKSIKAIKEASLEELVKVVGKDKAEKLMRGIK